MLGYKNNKLHLRYKFKDLTSSSNFSINASSSWRDETVQANGRCFLTDCLSWKKDPLCCLVASGETQSQTKVSAPSAAERRRSPIRRWKSGIDERTAGVSAQPVVKKHMVSFKRCNAVKRRRLPIRRWKSGIDERTAGCPHGRVFAGVKGSILKQKDYPWKQ